MRLSCATAASTYESLNKGRRELQLPPALSFLYRPCMNKKTVKPTTTRKLIGPLASTRLTYAQTLTILGGMVGALVPAVDLIIIKLAMKDLLGLDEFWQTMPMGPEEVRIVSRGIISAIGKSRASSTSRQKAKKSR